MSNIEYGKKNYDSTTNAFFRQNINNDIEEHNSLNILDNNVINYINELKKINLPKNIEDFFINHNAYESEIYINNYTFISIKKILELYEFYKKDNINNIIDLGFIYKGMGFIEVIYYNTKFNKLFFRVDGGSNNYDRKHNYDIMKKISEINNIENINDLSYDFEEILNIVDSNITNNSTNTY
jgi:hypothetical protein